MINILGKIDKDYFKGFSNSDFRGYEVYVRSEEDFGSLREILKELNIVSVHQPHKNFNLCSEGEIGEGSFAAIKKMLLILDKNGYQGVVVIHGAQFDEIKSSKDKHFKIMAERIDRLALLFPGIKITMETDVLFFNQIKSRRALLTEADDFLKIAEYLKTKLYITLDFEHVWLSAVFKDFIKNSPDSCIEIKSLADLLLPEAWAVKRKWLSYIKKNKTRIEELALRSLEEYQALKSSIINFHINGSDRNKYWYDKKIFTPLCGEHKSIKEKKDLLYYGFIKNSIESVAGQAEINLILEIWPRKKGSQYVAEIKKSGQAAKKLFAVRSKPAKIKRS
jgi:hypothetical protein